MIVVTILLCSQTNLYTNRNVIVKRMYRCTRLREVMFVLGCLNDVIQNDIFVSAQQTSKMSRKEQKQSTKPRPLVLNVRWFAPFLSGGGYSSEALSYVVELEKHINVAVVQHGDSVNAQFVEGLPSAVKETLQRAMYTRFPPRSTIDICHSEPGAWSVPTPMYPTSTCPSQDRLYAVGRTMFETDRLPDGWSRRLKAMDEVWVPSAFHEKIFHDAGVARENIHVIPEAVDTKIFDPSKASPHRLLAKDKRFKFLSVFKWETRKGWDILIEAFLSQFPARDNKAVLYIKTMHYHTDGDFKQKILKFASEALGLNDPSDISNIIVLDQDLALEEMAQLYASSDCFVLPSRGEGWGRPHIEAMAMGIPVVATNWSGNTEFMKPHNSFLIPIEGLEPVRQGAFVGHMWAKPSVKGLKSILQQIFDNPGQARKKAQVGMREVRELYNPSAVSQVVIRRLQEIEQLVSKRSPEGEL